MQPLEEFFLQKKAASRCPACGSAVTGTCKSVPPPARSALTRSMRHTRLSLLLAAAAMRATGSVGNGAAPPVRPMLLHDAAVLHLTWARLAEGDSGLLPAFGRVVHEGDGQLRAGPFAVVNSQATPPSGDKHDYVSIGVYFWPCARVAGLGPCDLARLVRSKCCSLSRTPHVST